MKAILMVPVLAIFLVGCVGTTTVTTTYWSPDSSSDINSINERVLRKYVRLTLPDSSTTRAERLVLAPDSANWFTSELDRVARPVMDIRQIRITQPSYKPAGIMGGMVAGGLIGVLLAPKKCEGSGFECGWGENMDHQLSPLLGAFLGGVLGSLILPAGRQTNYIQGTGSIE